MFCSNCGKPIDDDRTLCEQCENAIGSEPPVDEVHKAESDDFDAAFEEQRLYEESDAYNADLQMLNDEFILNTPTKKKPSKKWIIPVAAAVVVVIAALVAVFWKPITGMFDKSEKFDTPQEHFSHVEDLSADQFATDLASAYGTYLATQTKQENANEYEAHILLGDQALNLLSAYWFEDQAVDISWLKDIMINLDGTAGEDYTQAILTLGLGDDEVISADVILDMATYMMWVAIPELSNSYLKYDFNALYESQFGYAIDDSKFGADYYTMYQAALPSQQVVYQLAQKYTDIILEKVTDVVSAKETVTVGEYSQKCTVLTATITEKNLAEICLAVMETLKEDEVILGVIGDLAKIDDVKPEDAKEEFIEEIESCIRDMNDILAEADDANYLQWIDYVDDFDQIIGRRFTISGSEHDVYYLTVTSDEKFACEVSIPDNFASNVENAEYIHITGNGNIVDGIVNASYKLRVEGDSYLNIDLVDFNISKMENGYLDGKILLEPKISLYEEIIGYKFDTDLVIEIVMYTSDAQSKFEVRALLADDLFAGVTFKRKSTETTVVDQPAKIVDPNDQEQVMEWFKSFDFETVISNLKKTDMPMDLVAAIEEYCELIVESIAAS